MITPPSTGRRRRRRRRTSTASTNPILDYSSGENQVGFSRTAFQAAGATAGAYVGGFQGAVEAYEIAGNVYDVGENLVDYFNTPPPRNVDALDHENSSFPKKMSYGYDGGLGIPYKKKPSWEAKVSGSGFLSYKETYGSVQDDNCVYITHSTFDINVLAFTLQACWIRKLMKKAGFTIDDNNEIVPSNALLGSEGMEIVYYIQGPLDGAIATYQYGVTAGIKFLDVVTNFVTMRTHLIDYFEGSTGDLPYKMAIFQADQYSAVPLLLRTNFMSMINLTNEVITVQSQSTITLQNRTSGASAGVENRYVGDRLDNQPLHGLMYNFDADPRVKYIGTNNANIIRLQGIASNGVLLQGSSDFANENGYQNVPEPQVFSNCKKSCKIIMQPGSMKKSILFHKVSGKLINMFPKMRVETGSPTKLFGVKCKTQLIALDEILRSGSANKVTVFYERQLIIGVTSKTIANNILIKPVLENVQFSYPVTLT